MLIVLLSGSCLVFSLVLKIIDGEKFWSSIDSVYVLCNNIYIENEM